MGTQPTTGSHRGGRTVAGTIQDSLDVDKYPTFRSPASFNGKSWDKARNTERHAVAKPSPVASGLGLTTSGDWHPSFSQISLRDNHGAAASRAGVSGSYLWNTSSGQNLGLIPNQWGVEFKVHLYNETIEALDPQGQRQPAPIPSCTSSPNVKDQFWAKNYAWASWSVYKIGTTSLDAIGAYADINDLYDECYRQNLSIGVGFPLKVPKTPNGNYQLNFDIYAAKGNVLRNRVGATVEAKEGNSCIRPEAIADPDLSYDRNHFSPGTDCMGIGESTSFPSANGDQVFTVLGASKGAAYPSSPLVRVPVYTVADGLPEYCVYLNRAINIDPAGNPVPQRACDGS